MRMFLWLIVMISGLVLFGCDSTEQPKQQTETITTQSAKVAEIPKSETTPSAAPVTESAPPIADLVPAKAEQTTKIAETTMVEAAKPATTEVTQAVTVVKATADTTKEQVGAAAVATEVAVKTPTKAAVTREIVLQASYGNITFPHGMHAEAYECSICHGEATPAAFGITKEIAHKLCKDCHKELGSGPTACTGCHKK
jgi:predicted CXXCH cytochrome family protein